jgi:hypothetical protein
MAFLISKVLENIYYKNKILLLCVGLLGIMAVTGCAQKKSK